MAHIPVAFQSLFPVPMECFMQNSIRKLNRSCQRFSPWLSNRLGPAMSVCLAACLVPTAFGQSEKDTKIQKKQASVIVLSDTQASKEKILEQLRDKLQMLPEQQRDSILKQVEESFNQISQTPKEQRVVVTTVDADGKPVSNEGNVVTMTIIQDGNDTKDGKKAEARTRVEARVKQLSQEELPKEIAQLLPKIQDGQRIVKGFRFSENLGSESPSFRIGLSVEAPEAEGASDGKSTLGLSVERVMEDSPASKAGIQEGDVILSINGQDAESFSKLQEAVQEAGKDDRALKLKLQRDGKELNIKVKPIKSENTAAMNFDLVPPVGSLMPLELLQGQDGGRFLFGQAPMGQKELAETKQQVADLRQEVQELKAMVKKLLESADKK